MHWTFFSVTNAFQDESWDLSNSKGYEFDRIIQVAYIIQVRFIKNLVLQNKLIILDSTTWMIKVYNLILFF